MTPFDKFLKTLFFKVYQKISTNTHCTICSCGNAVVIRCFAHAEEGAYPNLENSIYLGFCRCGKVYVFDPGEKFTNV